MITRNPLVELHIPKNHIRAEGAKLIAKYLKNAKCLSVIDVFSNNIQDDGAVALLDAMREVEILRGFNMGQNDLSYRTVDSLCEIIEKSAVDLEFIKYAHNYIGRGMNRVLEVLSEHKSVETVDIAYNCGGEVSLSHCTQCFESKRMNTDIHLLLIFSPWCRDLRILSRRTDQ